MTFIRRVRVLLALTILLGAGVGVLVVVQALTLSRIIARVFLQGADLAGVWGLLLALAAIMVARAVLAWGSDVVAFEAAARVKTDLREQLLAHLLARGPAYARGERTGELANTAIEGIEALEAYVGQYLPQLALAVLVPLGILVFVFPVDLLSGIVLLLTGPLIPLFMILIGQAAEVLTQKQYRSLSLMSAHFLDVLQGLTTLKILGRSADQAESIAAVSQRFAATTLGVLRVAFLSAFALEMIATISTAIVAVQVGLRLLYGQVEFEQAFFVLVLAPDFYLPLRLLGTRFHAGMAGTAAAARIYEVLGDGPQPLSFRSKTPEAQRRERGDGGEVALLSYRRGEIGFEDVHYAYDGGRRALDGVSFAIGAGQHVALVGPSGAGKSTVFNLLLRFIEPDRGQIICGGVPLCDIAPEEWRAQMAWVPQDPYLFADTVAANIRLARPAASMEDVVRAAEQAHADEFIRALPQGYDTPIGERGARLSGGQRQRIALARAFLKDAPLLLLDEATANLDVENASLVQHAVDSLMRERTTLTITHRLNTAACADLIVVLANGRVAEIGAHAELARQGGIYHRLVAAGRMEGVR